METSKEHDLSMDGVVPAALAGPAPAGRTAPVGRELIQQLTEDAAAPANQTGEPPAAEKQALLQERLAQITRELEHRQLELAETHATLRVLLRQRETEAEEFQARIRGEINERVRPFLNELTQRRIGAREKALLEVVLRNLDELVSPLPQRMMAELGRLSPAESQVVHLVRQGRTSKEIAGLLGVAPSTIDFHRHNIRRKLNLSNTPLNLRSYLNTLR